MAWSLRASTPATATGAVPTLTLTLGAACVVNDRVIVAVAPEANGTDEATTAVSGTFCGTFTKDAETAAYTQGSFNGKLSVWSAPVTSAGTPVLTITIAGTGPGAGSAAAAAYSGLNTSVGSAAVDVAATNQKNSGIDALPTVTTGATTAANELVFGASGNNGNSLSFTAGTGYTTRTSLASADADIAIEDKDSGATGTQVVNGTWSATTEWGMVGVVYKLAGGAAGTARGARPYKSVVLQAINRAANFFRRREVVRSLA